MPTPPNNVHFDEWFWLSTVEFIVLVGMSANYRLVYILLVDEGRARRLVLEAREQYMEVV